MSAGPSGTPEDRRVPGAALLDLVAIMDRLRRECPWDASQTHESLAPYLLEETYEALEAIERHDLAELCGELGDVLLQVLFHARVASERTDGTGFDIDDVATQIADKLVRRHPHVFADVSVAGADEVLKNWDTIKAEERANAGGDSSSALDGVPMAQPALSLAAQLQRRAKSSGAPASLADLADPAAEGETEAERVSPTGAELFALVAQAMAEGLNPELELRTAARVFRDRFRSWERSAPY
jgi:MazG family protein